jgi:hypothetical protein
MTECLDPAIPETIWITLTPRQMELMLWQFIADMGGEISTVPADDIPGRNVMFYRDDGERIGMIANEECNDE